MYEIELKVRADHEAIRRRLEELSADACGAVEQRDTYYDAPMRSFAETDEALRIRRETPIEPAAEAGETTTRITYKGPLLDAESKSRTEHETNVDDGDTMDAILRSLGFEPAATVEKRRRRFFYDGYTVVLDTVDGLGEFLEVETDVELDDEGTPSGDRSTAGGTVADHPTVVEARMGAKAVLERLGADPGEQIRTSYLGMLLDK
ncbi:MAG: class IV adenylate cyclase [Natronomonas sp.]